MTRGKTVEVECNCGKTFTARVADRKRGWAKSCSKSCAAKRRDNSKYFKGVRRYHGANVSRKRREADAREFGGIPQYKSNGDYDGFVRTEIEGWDDHKS